jgi:hypothetical protein
MTVTNRSASGWLVFKSSRNPGGRLRCSAVLLLGILICASAVGAVRQQHRTFEPGEGSLLELAEMSVPRIGHTATMLGDGTVLIIGGWNGSSLVASAEIYDPARRTFTPAGWASAPRAGHTATLLADGRVLIAGGQAVSGTLSSTETYDPATRRFMAGAPMSRARAGHTATVLSDGDLLVAGGDFEGTAELFDCRLQQFILLPSALGEARSGHSAIRLEDSRVVIAGGVSPLGEPLASAEIFNPDTLEFEGINGSMRMARHRPVLRSLSDGKVQVIGGDEAGTMEMFNPRGTYFTALARVGTAGSSTEAVLRSPGRAALLRGSALETQSSRSLSRLAGDAVSTTSPEVTGREDTVVTEIPSAGQALVTGGIRGLRAFSGAVIVSGSSAEVTTDQTDYYPGDTVVMTGSGYLPGETVVLVMEVQKDGVRIQDDIELRTEADEDGNFEYSEFMVDESHLGATFLLTATGETSGFVAQTTFTDSPKVGSVTVGAQSPAPVSAGGSATYTVTVNRGSGSGSSGLFTAVLSITTTLPTG